MDIVMNAYGKSGNIASASDVGELWSVRFMLASRLVLCESLTGVQFCKLIPYYSDSNVGLRESMNPENCVQCSHCAYFASPNARLTTLWSILTNS